MSTVQRPNECGFKKSINARKYTLCENEVCSKRIYKSQKYQHNGMSVCGECRDLLKAQPASVVQLPIRSIQKETELKMFGCDIDQFVTAIKHANVDGIEAAVLSVLNSALDMLSDGDAVRTRQAINRAQYLIITEIQHDQRKAEQLLA